MDEGTVGRLHYDRIMFDIDDRALAHLQIMITQKLRRGECFMLTFSHPGRDGGISNTIGMNHGSVLHFSFGGSRLTELNKKWLELLMTASHSTSGLDLSRVAEPTADNVKTAG